jgi:hypothetical protein
MQKYRFIVFISVLPKQLACFYVKSRLVEWGRGYGVATPIAPRPISCRPSVHRLLVPPVNSRGAPRQVTWETSVSEGWNYGREMAGQFVVRFRLPPKSQGSFTCRKSATWDRRLYFPSEGRHAVDLFARKIRRLRPGSIPRSWVPEVYVRSNLTVFKSCVS